MSGAHAIAFASPTETFASTRSRSAFRIPARRMAQGDDRHERISTSGWASGAFGLVRSQPGCHRGHVVVAVESLLLSAVYASKSRALTAVTPLLWSAAMALVAAFVAFAGTALSPLAMAHPGVT